MDCATQEELLTYTQLTNDGRIYLTNADPAFPSVVFDLTEVLTISADWSTHWTRAVWDSTHWASYIKAALCYLTCTKCDAHARVLTCLRQPTGAWHGVRIHVTSPAPYALSHSGGLSSSAALK